MTNNSPPAHALFRGGLKAQCRLSVEDVCPACHDVAVFPGDVSVLVLQMETNITVLGLQILPPSVRDLIASQIFYRLHFLLDQFNKIFDK